MFERIGVKLDELRRLDRSRKIFASDHHRYRLNPPLAPKRVEKIEERLGVLLPDQYRRFVTEFADGGAGPDYGVLPLERWVGRRLDRKTAELLARPFPVPRSLRAMRKLEWSPPGVMEIAEIGCGGFYLLVMSGPDRGYVWICNPDGDWMPELSDESHLPAYREWDGIDPILGAALRSPKALKLQFVDWYEKWLDDSLRRLKAKRAKRRRSAG